MDLLPDSADERNTNERTDSYYGNTDLDHHVAAANVDCGLVVAEHSMRRSP
jgi:hypothetical protein